jgi:6-pyruvoyltetrahydropterin/6-carboxytetrahydropterin synthase
MELSICKVFGFEYAHFLPGHKGLCKNVHGHSGRLEIEISGPVGNHSGMVLDFGDLKQMVTEKVLVHLDHTFLNNFTYFTENPTAENIVMWVVKELQPLVPFPKVLRRVRVWETTTSYAEWRKE